MYSYYHCTDSECYMLLPLCLYIKEEDRIVRKESRLLKENLEKPNIQDVSSIAFLFIG